MIEDILSKAIEQINSRHYSITNPKKRIINEEVYDLSYSKATTQPENNFVTYLIAHYLVELDKIENLNEDDDVTIYPQIQLYKKIVKKEGNEQIIEDFKLSQGLYPDIVFHKEQNDNNLINQKVVIECKINNSLSYEDFSYDFAKLYIYVNEINFQKAIYLIVNNSATEIIDHFIRFKEKYDFDFSLIDIWIKNNDEKLIIKNCS